MTMTKTWWAYRDYVVTVESNEPEAVRDEQKEALVVKQFILRRERDYERVRREVEALENLDKLEGMPREPIPESVRLFVWQRDGGKCVKCRSRARLEFDHIIPLAAGGSSTERNIQLLCEACNRSKGSSI
jgi:5-methylcytosine-specific restriction endonuclease McrA